MNKREGAAGAPSSAYLTSLAVASPPNLLNAQDLFALDPAQPPHFASVAELVDLLRPDRAIHVLRPHVLELAAKWFLRSFPGDVLYAVKCNPSPVVLRAFSMAGIRHFDVASLAEIELVAAHCPRARMHFMHPVKSRSAIHRAYFDYGVRDFVLDSVSELFKIVEETGSARDLGLLVRLAVPKGECHHALTTKFGADPATAADLLRQARRIGVRVGLAFHVGSQTMSPAPYAEAIALAGRIIAEAKISPDILDIGGGFPVAYPGLTPPPLADYMTVIREAIAALNLPRKTKLWCEPGRALAAEAGSLVTRVELRRGTALYINDGVYGSLFDAGITRLHQPVRALRPDGVFGDKMQKFSLFGPTCDSIDAIKGPYPLPADIGEGDWIEFGQAGAYGAALASSFNGFTADALALAKDAPLMPTPAYWT